MYLIKMLACYFSLAWTGSFEWWSGDRHYWPRAHHYFQTQSLLCNQLSFSQFSFKSWCFATCRELGHNRILELSHSHLNLRWIISSCRLQPIPRSEDESHRNCFKEQSMIHWRLDTDTLDTLLMFNSISINSNAIKKYRTIKTWSLEKGATFR